MADAAELRSLAIAWLNGEAQMFFCESPLAGALLLLGLVPIAPWAAAASTVGGLLATLVARVWRYPAIEWRRGFYGYAGSLVGLFWGFVFVPRPGSAVLLMAAALLAAPLTRLAHRLLAPREIPALALPALVLVWIAAPGLERTVPGPPGSIAQLAGGALIAAGLAWSSRLVASAAALGVVVGVAVGLLTGREALSGILANSVPTAIALGAVFLPWSAASAAVAAVAAAIAGTLWCIAAGPVGAAGVPVLVAPFNVVVVAAVSALRQPWLRRRIPGHPAPLPLASVGMPERSREAWRARRLLLALAQSAPRICVLTGAGVSTAAGLPDFRGPNGLAGRSRRITFDEFVRSAEARTEYWREEERFFKLVRTAMPATVHRAIAALDHGGALTAVVTQNVDGLHQAAGMPAERVIELHGTMRAAVCIDCSHEVPRERLSSNIHSGRSAIYCPICQGLLKSGSVMFGEPVAATRLEAALRAVLASDLLLVLGTSLAVAPASDMVRWAREAGIPITIVNATRTPYDHLATIAVAADVGSIMVDIADLRRQGLSMVGAAGSAAAPPPG